MTNLPRCKVCHEPERRRLVDADYSAGMSGAAIARRMTAAGWSVDDATIVKHLKEHYLPIQPPPGVVKRPRDAAIFVRERLLDEIERREDEQAKALEAGIEVPEWARLNILDKDLQPALGTALKAQAVIDKRESDPKSKKIELVMLMLGGADGRAMLAPLQLRSGDEGGIIEGEVVDVTPDEESDDE